MKKILCIMLSLVLLLLAVSCAAEQKNTEITGSTSTEALEAGEQTVVPTAPSDASEPGSEMTETPSEPTAEMTVTVPMTTATSYAVTTAAMTMAVAEAEMWVKGEADGGMIATATMPGLIEPTEPVEKPEVQVGAGMLTAGEWKDLENIPFWTNVLNNNEWFALMERRALFTNQIVPVKVIDQNGNSCFNVPIMLKDGDGKEIYRAVTDVNGMAYLLYDLDHSGQSAGRVSVGGVDHEIAKEGETVITSASAGIKPVQLDLLFMIDTTGSMRDELTYLQAELRDVIRKVAQSGEAYTIHLSVNFYRDIGDEYVVRSFAFTSDIDKAIDQINQQRSDGGGDYPEAVHLALQDVVDNHQWRKDAVKLCFMVLDAPPHQSTEASYEEIDKTLTKTVMAMSESGIRLIPIASSGVNTETEFLLRSWAVMTGGTYTFLTNHSGIGNSHLEPTIGEYEVEKLNDLLVRVICEYCGIQN